MTIKSSCKNYKSKEDQLLKEDQSILLFQMASDSSNKIDVMWADGGIANFFINRSHLKKLDFSQVLYKWDCS